MFRVAFMALALVGSLLTAPVEGQRNGPGFGRSTTFHAGQRSSGRFAPGFSRHAGFYWPYFVPDDEGFWTQETEQEPLQRILYSPPSPEQPVSEALLIEIPGTSEEKKAAPSPPAIFVLTNGERVEAQRFLLTATSVTLNIGHTQRVIPIAAVDLDSTVAANRQRGLRLQIPADRNEIFLGF